MVRDGLDELEIDFLRASGIEPDTLPQERDIRLDGAVRGSVSISGELASFDMGLVVDLTGGAFRHNEVDSARVGITATGLPSLEGSWGLGASARGVVWEGRSFEQGGFEASMIQGQGTGRIEIVRTEAEQYRLAGTFRRNDPGGEVGLETAQVQVGQDFWNLTRPATVAWGEGSMTIDSLRVDREGADPMWLEARGTLTRGGESDFRVTVRGLHVDRFVHVAQLSGVDVGGHVDLDLAVSGPAESPTIDGEFRVDGPRFRAMELTRIDGSLDYADQRAVFSLLGWDGGRDAIDASGEFPVDLSLAAVENRVLDRPMELRISADSLDAAIALSYLSDLQQVVGVVSGDVAIGGTPGAPAPEGSMRLSNAEWTIEALGVRHAGVNGDLTLNPDRTVDVSLTSTGTGRSTVEGSVTLEPFIDPPLNLVFRFDRFQAVERIDVEALISGQFALGGSYRRPVASGSLTLDEGTVYVDEFQRAAGVVDLSDPLLYERGLGVDTTALMSQPLLAGLRNPFLDNLRVDIQLAVPRDTWLRSIETNVEMAGDLLVAYDRSRNDLVLVGELQAVRGSHQVLNRTFEVDGGTVSFIGRPGLNPDLDIDASTRVRRREDDLEVLAHVGGTLIQPVVTLSTDDVGVGQADLVSYLIFGQPMTQLGSSQAQLMSQGSSNAVSGIAGDLGTWYGGALASQFGAALAQGGVVDYLSVQRGRALLSDTQVEAGRYLGRDVFVVVVFEPPTGGAESSNPVRGARVEWEATDGYHLEGFFEDRFLRSGAAGLALPDLLRNNFVVGLFVFREWGY
jgi:translocation and assembly module TamB